TVQELAQAVRDDVRTQASGPREIFHAAVAADLGKLAAKPGPLAVLRRQVWRGALLSAYMCDALGPRNGARRDQAFFAGLLHDYGKIQLAATLEAIGGAPT